MIDSKYGICSCCKATLRPEWFTDEEYKYDRGIRYKTGRKRRAIASLNCPVCLKQYPVDDSFDGPWMDNELFEKTYGAQEG